MISAFTHRGRDFNPNTRKYRVPPHIPNPQWTGNSNYTAIVGGNCRAARIQENEKYIEQIELNFNESDMDDN